MHNPPHHLPHTVSFISSILKLEQQQQQQHQHQPSSSSSSNNSSPISSSSDSLHSNNNNNHQTLIPTILSILTDTNDDEDEKPERLKSFLANSTTHLSLLPEPQLNQLILSILHQHRQDIHHNNLNTFQQPSLTRSSSQRITIGKSRFQPRSTNPHPSSTPNTPPFSARFIQPTLSKPIQPSFNLQPPPAIDRLNASALEFKPILSRAVSMPYQPTNHQPLIPPPPDSARLSPQTSFFIDSPRSAIHQASPSANSPYFPRNSRPATPEIPRDPWLKEIQTNPHESPRIQSRLQIEQQLDYNQQSSDPNSLALFLPFQTTTSPLKSPLSAIITDSSSPGLPNSNKIEPSCPTALQWGLSPEMAEEMAQFTAWDHSESDGSQPPTIVHHPPQEQHEEEGLGDRYWMSPYDELCATLAGTGVSEALIDEALGQTGFDTNKAIDWLLNRHGIPSSHQPDMLSIDRPPRQPSSSREPSPVRKPISPAPSIPSSPRFTPDLKPRAQKPSSIEESAFESSPSHRVCRFYLQGCCLRSDCKFSHDVGKAICRFWLKGHCLKGESKCDFLHEIPDLTQEEGQTTMTSQDSTKQKQQPIIVRSFADEFPSLEESVGQQKKKPMNRLRPVHLLPELTTSKASPSLVKLTQTYRARTLEFSMRRKQCFDLAKECFKRADGAGVKKWSKEADDWNKRLADEPRAIAGSIITERNRLMKDAVRSGVSGRMEKVDEGPDRMHRGKEMGGGICLGVVAPTTRSSYTVKERMEVLMDLHGLNPDDGVYYLEKFTVALKAEGFQGLAYVLTSSESSSFFISPSASEFSDSSSSHSSHPSSSSSLDLKDPSSLASSAKILTQDQKTPQGLSDQIVIKDDLKLEKAIKNWLDRKRFSSDSSSTSSATSPGPPSRQGIICIDPLR